MDVNWERIFRDENEKWYEAIAWNIVFRRWFFRIFLVFYRKGKYAAREIAQELRC